MYFNGKKSERREECRTQPVTIIRGSKAINGRRREKKRKREEKWKAEQESEGTTRQATSPQWDSIIIPLHIHRRQSS